MTGIQGGKEKRGLIEYDNNDVSYITYAEIISFLFSFNYEEK